MMSFIMSGGCNKRPEGVLSENDMVDLLADIELAEAYYNTTAGPGSGITREMLIESVLQKHGVTHAELDSTMAYYGRNIDDYYALYEKVETKLRKRSNEGTDEQTRQEDDIWPYSRFASFLPNQTSDGIVFSMGADEIQPGNTLEWAMRLTSTEGVELMLGVDYADGGSSLIKKNSSGTRTLQINLQTDTVRQPKRIYGVMKLPERARPVWADSIRLIKSEYDSMNYSKIRSQNNIWRPIVKKDTLKGVSEESNKKIEN